MLEQAPGKNCGTVEIGAHPGASLLAGHVTPWETHAQVVCEELQPVRRRIGEAHNECLLWKGPHPVVGEEDEESSL